MLSFTSPAILSLLTLTFSAAPCIYSSLALGRAVEITIEIGTAHHISTYIENIKLIDETLEIQGMKTCIGYRSYFTIIKELRGNELSE